jgi:parallel beta-helix repeat protein
MWRKLIPALVVAIAVYFVWQETTQGRIGLVSPGVVTVSTNTDAQLYIDGQLSGTIRASQMRVLSDLKPGRHILGLTALGYKSKNLGVMVENGQKLEQVFKLEPEVIALPKIKTVGFNDLAQSIANAEDGAVLFLAAGEYKLLSTIKVQKSISLIGAGQALTRISSSASVALMSFKTAELHLKGIGFVHTGKQKADVLDIKDAQIKIEDCRFSGGYTPDSPRKDGDGIWLHGRSSGSIINSWFERNAMNGLEVRDDSNVMLVNNKFNRNQSAGLSIWDDAKVEVSNSVIEFNKKRGIYASNQASATISRNTLTFNQSSGITFSGSATGVVENNTLIGNTFGMEIMEQSTVSVSKNKFNRHDQAIYVAKQATAKIGQNGFENNKQKIVYEKKN